MSINGTGVLIAKAPLFDTGTGPAGGAPPGAQRRAGVRERSLEEEDAA